MKFSYAPPVSESDDEEEEEEELKKPSTSQKGKMKAKAKSGTNNKTVLQKNRRTGFAVSYMSSSSYSSSFGSNGSSSSEKSEDNEDEHSETDSENEEFPVGSPDKNGGRRSLSRHNNYNDPLEVLYAKEQQKAWQRAQAAHNRDLVALRTIRLNAFARAEVERNKACDNELELVRLILQDVDLRRQREEELVDRQFKARNKQRWDEINTAIAQLEQIQSAAEAQRVKQVQAEQKAKEERDEEESKIHREEEETKKEQENIEAFRRKQAREMAEERAKNAKQQENIVDVSPKTAAPNQPAGSATSTVPLSGNAQNKTRLEFEKWHAKIIEIKSTVLPAVSSNPSWRNACRNLKRSLSTRISNISASAADVRSKTQEIHTLLNESKSTPQTYLWALNLLSKRIIGMANMNTEDDQSGVTYALAQVVIALLCSDHEELAEILMARLVKRCPYVLPFHPSRGSLTTEEFGKLVGRKVLEPSISYNQRMSGIVSLYAAIVQTSPSTVPNLLSRPMTSQHIPPYFRPEGGWKWYAVILRPPLPLLDLTPLLLYHFLRITGERFHSLYGHQYIKVVQAIVTQGTNGDVVKWNKDVQGDLSKVKILAGGWLENGVVKGAEGRQPA